MKVRYTETERNNSCGQPTGLMDRDVAGYDACCVKQATNVRVNRIAVRDDDICERIEPTLYFPHNRNGEVNYCQYCGTKVELKKVTLK